MVGSIGLRPPRKSSKFVIFNTFYSVPRLTSIMFFAPLPLRIVIFTRENVGEWETERTRKSSLRLRIRIFTRGNVGELETTNLLKSLRGHVQPRGLMSASWVPLGGLLGASWGAPGGHLGPQNVHFYAILHSFSLLGASGDARLQTLGIHAC